MTAINALKLLLLICLGLLFFVGQGWLVIGPLLHGSLITRKQEISRFQEIALMIISGLIINYGIVLLFQSLKVSFMLSSILAVIGVCFFVFATKEDFRLKLFTSNSLIKWLGVVVVCSLFLGPLIALPLTEWDARSIWFFHAKMIFTAGTFSQATGWQHPSLINFSHVDYPNLVPTIIAQVATLVGFWNEYLPKISLFYILVPGILLLFSFSRRSFSFLFLIVLIPFSFSPRLWNGYMDGYLSLFFALSMLLLGRYYLHSKSIDLISSLFCLLILLYLKNEGQLAVIAGICAIISVLIFKRNKVSIKNLFTDYWKLIFILLLLLIPFGIWTSYKNQWGLVNDLGLGTNQSIDQLMIRLNDGSITLIFQRVYEQLAGAIMLFGLLFFAHLFFKKQFPKEIIPAIISAGLYWSGMVAIYMITPLKLILHLNDSVDRTMLSVSVCIFAACYFLVASLEKRDEIEKITT